MIGDYNGLFLARATESALTGRGGGGVVTSTLLHLLREGAIDKALVTTASRKEPWAEPALVDTEEEVRKAAGSKYTRVDYRGQLGGLTWRSAAVGLPCQLRARFCSKIRIGLFCGLNLSPVGYDHLFHKLGFGREEIEFLEYRAPQQDYLDIRLKDGRRITYPRYYWLAYFYPYKRCIYCQDFTNRASDLSVGDFQPGWSCVITRTETGRQTLIAAERKGLVTLEELPLARFVEVKAASLFHKEVMGGYWRTRFVRPRGKLFRMVPLRILRWKGIRYGRQLAERSRRYFEREVAGEPPAPPPVA
ncbi:MAG: Coenzyme F420 hydrogenase/dehydrogenase, beta subunit C-terminal domain [bacterium]